MEKSVIGPRQYWLTRFCVQRSLGFIYLLGFLIAVNQFIPLEGEHGILPVGLYLKRLTFWDIPSLFWINHSDKFLLSVGWCGVSLALFALTGLSERFGILVSALIWFLLWLFYLSFVNAGQVFYGFGWESILLETGFLAIFLGASDTEPPQIVIWLIRWILFRVMFGAGLIKLRGDSCWRDLTCMMYHYETQPVPNPLSWSFHYLPPLIQKASVLFNHFVELIMPWGMFFPGPLGYAAGFFTIIFQLILIFSGNLSWLNYMTIVLCLSCFDDRILSRLIPIKRLAVRPDGKFRKVILRALTLMIVVLSIPPAINLISPRQIMNTNFNPLHLVNTYGAFGSITKTRTEVILEGTSDTKLTESTQWREYEFKCKPGNVARRPCLMSPYHYRIDWQMWFAAMSNFRYHPWILNLVAKFLQGDPKTLSLIANNPFPDSPPKYIRADLYEYHFTNPEEKKRTGQWWSRKFITSYLPPLSLDDPEFQKILAEQEWT